MSDQIREQVSAFLDGELPGAEAELLLKRLMRDAQLRASFGRYALIGEACRNQKTTHLTQHFAARVRASIDGEPLVVTGRLRDARTPRWWRHAASGAVAAGVAVVAVFALQQRANTPTVVNPAALASTATPVAAAPVAAMPAAFAPGVPFSPAGFGAAGNHEPLSYTVPATLNDVSANLPSARLTNYVFAHSEFSSLLGQRTTLSGLIAEPNEPLQLPPADRPGAPQTQVPDAHIGP